MGKNLSITVVSILAILLKACFSGNLLSSENNSKDPGGISLSYTIPSKISLGEAISFTPAMSRVETGIFSVNPSLPVGLSIDSSTGIISGTSTSPVGSQSYTVSFDGNNVTASNDINFSVEKFFTIDTNSDSTDSNPGNGVCADSSGDCSLRAAIEESNATPSYPGKIAVPPNTYVIGSTMLTITSNLEIASTLPGTPFTVSATGFTYPNATIFEVLGSSKNIDVSISDVNFSSVPNLDLGYLVVGAAISVNQANSFNLKNCNISSNNRTWAGSPGLVSSLGLVMINSGTLTIDDCDFDSNTVYSSLNAGAVLKIDSTDNLIIKNSSFTNNGGSAQGGTAYVRVSNSVVIENSNFVGNFVDSDNTFSAGAALFLDSPRLEIDSSFFSNNTGAQHKGSAIAIYNSDVVLITNSTFSENPAGIGVLYLYNPDAIDIENTTIYMGTSPANLYILIETLVPTILNLNHVTTDGYIARIGSSSSVTVNIANSVLAASNKTNCSTGGTITFNSLGHNITTSDADGCGSFNNTGDSTDTDPLLVAGAPLDNGGKVPSIALQAGSPALDIIPAGICSSTPTDKIGASRTSETSCDSGALESP
ncbi:MAG: right-handed parallel beta-helix repeat-containing protein [Bdellovibrionales bacterium]